MEVGGVVGANRIDWRLHVCDEDYYVCNLWLEAPVIV